MTALQNAGIEDTRRALESAAAQHEVALKALKDKMLKEQEEAVEREHAAGLVKLREASERYEQQLTMQRMRLVSDGDLRLEQLEASRCVCVSAVCNNTDCLNAYKDHWPELFSGLSRNDPLFVRKRRV
eukprot:scaffold123650_cov15-Tisochrysis_lutea.AAC.1